MEDRELTRLAARVAAALREQVGPPDRWEVRPLRMGADDDETAPMVLLLHFSRPVHGTVVQWEQALSPHALEFSFGGVEGIVHLLAIHWKVKVKQYELATADGRAADSD